MVIRRTYWCALYCALLVGACGCAEKQELLPVAGTVLIDGQPLPMGSIQFVPESGRPFASKIRPDGTFRLTRVSVSKEQGGGVLQGKYRIGVASAEVIDEDGGEIRRHVPMRYADYSTSELEMEIREPQEDLVIELTWEGSDEIEDPEEQSVEDSEESGNSELRQNEAQKVELAEPADDTNSREPTPKTDQQYQ